MRSNSRPLTLAARWIGASRLRSDDGLTAQNRGEVIQIINYWMSARVCTENLSSGVVVVKSAQNGACTDHTGSLNRARNRRILLQGSMRSNAIVQRGLRTPTGPFFARFFIGIILGLVAEFAFMGQSTKLVMSSSAAR